MNFCSPVLGTVWAWEMSGGSPTSATETEEVSDRTVNMNANLFVWSRLLLCNKIHFNWNLHYWGVLHEVREVPKADFLLMFKLVSQNGHVDQQKTFANGTAI